ncbi:Transcription elongation regulator 1 [Ceratobasidium theobromae]|uniref:Transcription elongation regulator 1 n=1 Tax=Ceratobasidium theobromae TaxID=1582974 RepID=A0A5N5QJ80_9AGAM|nr:Transcription elongation regulator 1 [Ceratobasidium theobromae]
MVTKFTLAIFSVLSASYIIHNFRKRRRHLPPGPPSYPIIGQLLSAPRSLEHLGYKRMSEKLKSVPTADFQFLGKTVIVVHSSQAVNDLLDKSSLIYSDRTRSTMLASKKLLNWSSASAFSSAGPAFREFRRIVNTWLNKNASTAFHDRQVFQTRQLLRRLLGFDGIIVSSESLEPELYRLTAASIIGAIYGYEVTSLDDPFVTGVRQVVEILLKSLLPTHFLVNLIPSLVHLPSWLPGMSWKVKAKGWRKIKEDVIESTYQWTRTQMANGTAGPSLLRSILEERSQSGEDISNEQMAAIKQIGLTLFAAGTDTLQTANTLTVFLMAMLLFPDTQRKAQNEIDQVIGPDRLPEMSDLPRLPYLANLVQELLRWQPILPLGKKPANATSSIPSSREITKIMQSLGNVWAMSRDQTVYKDPERFDPDRFLDLSVPQVSAFGWGRRKCPGIHYAESLLFISIASILATFDIGRVKDAQGRNTLPSVEDTPGGMFYFKFFRMAAVPPPPGVMFVPPPLPPGWTEHKCGFSFFSEAPSGHTYFYNAATKQSTYARPLPPIHMGGPAPPFPPFPTTSAPPPSTETAPVSESTTDKKSKKPKKEKPAKKTAIPNTQWVRVLTNMGNVFYTHTERKESVWTCPEEIAAVVAELEREEEVAKVAEQEREMREKAEKEQKEKEELERAEVERVKKEVEAAGAKRKAESSGAGVSKKPRVEDDQDEEEWQREVAEEMAHEAQGEEEQAPSGGKTTKEQGMVVPAAFKVPDRVKLNPEEAKALFVTLLNDVSPNPLLPYDLALPQLVNDARYVLLPPNDRKGVFDDWCKEQARNLRKNKTKEATTTPEEAYEALLRAEVKSTRTQWDEFRRKWKKDRKFYGYGRDDKEREKRFRAWLVELGEIKRKEAKRAEDDFMELLKTTDSITRDSEWKDVKRGISQDSRYDAVGSATRREELFNKFKTTVEQKLDPEPTIEQEPGNKGEKEKESKAARRERALKEREAQVRAAQSNVERDIGRSRGKLGREEAELEFGTVLTDAIRDPLMTWDSALPLLEADPRFQHASQVLPVGAQRARFATHIDHLRTRYITQLHALFEAHSTGLNMPAEALPKSVRGSLPAVKLGFVSGEPETQGPDDQCDEDDDDDEDVPTNQSRLNRGLADEYARWQRTKVTEARLAFDALLSENSFVEFWGRLAKMGGEGVGGGVPIDGDDEENEEGEGGGGKVDMKALAKNVDVSEMEKVLKVAPSTWTTMSDIVIREVTQNIWTFSRPFARFGILPFGGRSTAIRLQSGDVWVLASTPLSDETKAKLNELGLVKYICAPDAVHHMFIPEYKKEYPQAKVIGVPALVEKNKGVIEFDGVYGRDPVGTKYGYEPEIQACYFSGFENQDVAFLHVSSRTLIEADLLLNLPGREQYSKTKASPTIPFISLLVPSSRLHKSFVWSAGVDKAAMSRDAKTVSSWDFDRLIPCHGDVIETGAKAVWNEVYKREGGISAIGLTRSSHLNPVSLCAPVALARDKITLTSKNDEQTDFDQPPPPSKSTNAPSISLIHQVHLARMVAKLEQVAQNKAFEGTITKYKFVSSALGGLETHFNLFVPAGASASSKAKDTAPWKAGLLLPASQHSLALLFPDTSPRGANVPTEDDSWDFGTGAGFYLDATAPDWSKHYNMEKLITVEIQQVLKENEVVGNVLDFEKQSITGHSMGGHGAVSLYLKGVLGSGEGMRYKGASAFAPILHPVECPWGNRAFKGYLKDGLEEGKAHDATELIAKAKGKSLYILADYGTADNFYKQGQLLPEAFIAAAKDAGFESDAVNVREREGYDHSYYFVSTFVPEHIAWHAQLLRA